MHTKLCRSVMTTTATTARLTPSTTRFSQARATEEVGNLVRAVEEVGNLVWAAEEVGNLVSATVIRSRTLLLFFLSRFL
jgi:hypothetical protein